MKIIKKIVNGIRIFVEEYLTGVAFIVMLSTMVYGVVMRYGFKKPLTWGMEVQSICFVYMVFVGIDLSEHYRESVEFEMLYKGYNKVVKNICRLLGNLLTLVFIGIILVPASKYVFEMSNVTTVLRIPRNLVFAPFVIMMVFFVIRHGYWACLDIKSLINKSYEETYAIEEDNGQEQSPLHTNEKESE